MAIDTQNRPPDTLPADFSQWDAKSPVAKASKKPPETLPADFASWDTHPKEVAKAKTTSNPPATLPANHQDWDRDNLSTPRMEAFRNAADPRRGIYQNAIADGYTPEQAKIRQDAYDDAIKQGMDPYRAAPYANEISVGSAPKVAVSEEQKQGVYNWALDQATNYKSGQQKTLQHHFLGESLLPGAEDENRFRSGLDPQEYARRYADGYAWAKAQGWTESRAQEYASSDAVGQTAAKVGAKLEPIWESTAGFVARHLGVDHPEERVVNPYFESDEQARKSQFRRYKEADWLDKSKVGWNKIAGSIDLGVANLAAGFTTAQSVALIAAGEGPARLAERGVTLPELPIAGQRVARTVSKLANAGFTAMMAHGSIESFAQAGEAAREGDAGTAVQYAVEGLVNGLMAHGGVKHMEAEAQVRSHLNQTSSTLFDGRKFSDLQPDEQAIAIHRAIHDDPYFQAAATASATEAKRQAKRIAYRHDIAQKLSWKPDAMGKMVRSIEDNRIAREAVDRSVEAAGRKAQADQKLEEARQHYLKQLTGLLSDDVNERQAAEDEWRNAEAERRAAGREERPRRKAGKAEQKAVARGVQLAGADQTTAARTSVAEAKRSYGDIRAEQERIANEQAPTRTPERETLDGGYVGYRATSFSGEDHHFGVAQTPDGGFGVFRQTPDGTQFLSKDGTFSEAPETPFSSPNRQTADVLSQIASLRVTQDSLIESAGASPEREAEATLLRGIEEQMVDGGIDGETARKSAGLPAERPEVQLTQAQRDIEAAQAGMLYGPLHGRTRAEAEDAAIEEAINVAGWTDAEKEALLDQFPLMLRDQTENALHHIQSSGDYLVSKKGVRWTLDSKGVLYPDDGSAPIPLMKNGTYTAQALNLAQSGRIGFGMETREERRVRAAKERDADRQVANLAETVSDRLERAIFLAKQNEGLELITGRGEVPSASRTEGRRAISRPPREAEMFSAEREMAAGRKDEAAAERAASKATEEQWVNAMGDWIAENHATAWSTIEQIAKNSGMSPAKVLEYLHAKFNVDSTPQAQIARLKPGDTISAKMRPPWVVEQRGRGLFLRSGNAALIPINRFHPTADLQRIVRDGQVESAPGPRLSPEDIRNLVYKTWFATRQLESVEEVKARESGQTKDPEPRSQEQAEARAAAATQREGDAKAVAVDALSKATDPPRGTSLEEAEQNADDAEDAIKTAEAASKQQVAAADRTVAPEPFPERAAITMGPGSIGESTTVKHLGEEYPAHYVLAPINAVVGSHVWDGTTAVLNPEYNQELQPATISENESAEMVLDAQVRESGGRGYDFDLFADRTVGPLTGPMVAEKGGRIVAGNRRFLRMLMHLKQIEMIDDPEMREAYQGAFRARMKQLADSTGIAVFPSDGQQYVVLRMLDKPIETRREAAHLGMLFNKNTSVEIREGAKGVALARMLSDQSLEDIGRMLDQHETLGEAIASSPQVFTDIVRNELRVAQSEEAGWFNDTKNGKVLSDSGRRRFVSVLMGKALGDSSVLEAIQGTPAYTSLERAVINLTRLAATKHDYLVPKIVEATQAAAQTIRSRKEGESVSDDWEVTFQPKAMSFAGMEEDTPPMPDKVVETIWRAIFAGPRTLSDRIKAINATDRISVGGSLFDTDQAPLETPRELFNRVFRSEIAKVERFRKAKGGEGISDAEFEAALRNRTLSDAEEKDAKRQAKGEEHRRPETAALRKRIDQLTGKEKDELLLTSRVTGLPNMIDFEEHNDPKLGGSPAPVVGFSDLAGLKAFNETYGHVAGDKLLGAAAQAMRDAGLEAYHRSGDEFLYRGSSEEDLKAKLDRARDILRNTPIEIEKDGKTITLKGADFTYGLGKDLVAAEDVQHQNKAEEVKSGQRGARGEFGGIKEAGPKFGPPPTQEAIKADENWNRYVEEKKPFMAPPEKNGVTVAPTQHPMTYLTGSHNLGVAKTAKERGDIGLLVTPLIPTYLNHVEDYPVIGVDNGVFSKSQPFDPVKFRDLIDKVAANPEAVKKVRFVVAPDVVGDAEMTLAQFDDWADEIHAKGLPVALAAQDGLEKMLDKVPWDKVDVLFIGGSTDWKLGKGVGNDWYDIFREADKRGIPVHVGRVNSGERINISEYGLNATTADGTFIAFGPEKNKARVEDWLNHQNRRDDIAGGRESVKQDDSVPWSARPDEEDFADEQHEAQKPRNMFEPPKTPSEEVAEAEVPGPGEGVRVGKEGDKMAPGEVVLTATGRKTTPFPKVDTSTNGKTVNTLRRVDQWLMDNAVEEAKARGDEFNLRQFEQNRNKPTQADKDSAELYLFDKESVHPIPKSIFKADKGLAAAKQGKGYVTPEELLVFLKEHPSSGEHADTIFNVAQRMAEYVYDLDPPPDVERKDALAWALQERVAGLESGGTEKKRGSYATEEGQFGRGIIAMHKAADATTFIHEFAHAIFPLLSETDMKAIDSIQGPKGMARWSGARSELKGDVFNALSEKFAHGLEKFIRDENPAGSSDQVNPALKVLKKMKEAFIGIYRAMVKDPLSGYSLSEEAKQVFSDIFNISEFDAADDFRRDTEAARQAEKKKKGITRPDQETTHPLVEAAKQMGADGIVKSMTGDVLETAGDRVDPSKPTVTYTFKNIEKGATAWVDIEKSGIKGAELVEGEDGTYGIRFNVDKDPPKNVLYQESMPKLQAGLELEKLQNQLKEATSPMMKRLLELRIEQVKSDVRLKYGVETPRPQAHPELAKAAIKEVKRETATPELRRVPDKPAGTERSKGITGVPQPPVMGMPRYAAPAASAERPRGTVVLADVKPVNLVPQKPRGKPVGILHGDAFDDKAWKDGLKRAGLPENLPAPTVGLSPETAKVLKFAGQKQIVQTVLSALEQGDGAVIASATGSGKSYTSMAVAKETLNENPDARILVITKNRKLLKDLSKVANEHYDMKLEREAPAGALDKNLYGASYARLRTNPVYMQSDWDLVIADESGEARNWFQEENQQGKNLIAVMDKAKKGVYVSATPFHSPNEYGYLEKLNLWKKGEFPNFIKDNFAHEKVGDKIIARLDPGKQAKFRQQLIERGQFVSQEIPYDGFTAHFGVVPVTEEIRRKLDRIAQGIQVAKRELLKAGKKGLSERIAAFEATYTKAYLERSRLPEAIQLVKRARAQGWQVAVFSETTSEDLFRRPVGPGEEAGTYRKLDEESGGLVSRIMPAFPNVVDELRKEFGKDLGDYSGVGNTDAEREANLQRFISGELPVLYTSYAAGGIGLSLHDTAGDKPRLSVFLGPPYSGVLLEQAMGRLWRFGVKSDTRAVFLATDSEPDIRLMATKVGPRMRALRASVLGERDSLASVMTTYSDEERMREQQDILAYDQGNEVKVDAQGFTVRSKRKVGFDNWSAITFPKATEAMHRGMNVEESGAGREGDDWTVLYQDNHKPWEPPPLLKFGERRVKQAVNRVADSIANGSAPGVQNLDPRARQEIAGGAAAVGQTAAELPVDRDEAAAARMAASAAYHQSWELGADGVWRYKGDPSKLERGEEEQAPALPTDVKTDFKLPGFFAGEIMVRDIARQAGNPKAGVDIVIANRKYTETMDGIYADYVNDLNEIQQKTGLNFNDKNVMQKIWGVVEGKKTSNDPKINQAAAGIMKMHQAIRDHMADAGVKLKTPSGDFMSYEDIEADPNYMPHRIDWNAKLEDPATKEKYTLKQIMGKTFGDAKRERMIRSIAAASDMTPEAVIDYLNNMRTTPPVMGHIHRARTINFPIYRQDLGTELNYINQVAHAIATEKIFGSDLRKLNELIDKVPSSNGRATIHGLFDSLFRPQDWNTAYGRLYNAMASYEAISKMTWSALKVPFHLGNAPLALGGDIRPMGKAVWDSIVNRKEFKENTAMAGTIIREMNPMLLVGDVPEHGFVRQVFKKTQFEKAYRWSRAIAGASAKVYMEQYAMNDLRKGGTRAEEARRILKERLLIGDRGIDQAIERGHFTEDQLRTGQRAFANFTVFSDNPLQMPAWARMDSDRGGNTYGDIAKANLFRAVRMTYLLQSFAVKIHSLVKEAVYDEVVHHHNYKPLLYLMIAEPALGTMLRGVGAAIPSGVHRGIEEAMGKKHDTDSWDKFLDKFRALHGDHPVAAALQLYVDGLAGQTAFDLLRILAAPMLDLAMADKQKARAALGYMKDDIIEQQVGPAWSSLYFGLINAITGDVKAEIGKDPADARLRNFMRFLTEEVPATRIIPGIDELTKKKTAATGGIGWQ